MIDPMQWQGPVLEPEVGGLGLDPGLGAPPPMPMPAAPEPPLVADQQGSDLIGVDPAAQVPPDPVSLALDAILDLPGQEAVRRVYQLATSAARAKARVAASLDKLDARSYHDLLSRAPEARFAQELIAARRRLDLLAQERRNLNLQLAANDGKATEPRRRMLEVQSAMCTMAMEQVAAGTLIYLAIPSDAFLSQPTEPLEPVQPPEAELTEA